MSDQQERGGEDADAAALARESNELRWESHAMQGAHIELNLRFKNTMRALESRDNDQEAKTVLLEIAKDFKRVNEGLVSRLTRLSMINRTVVDLLRKSEDGRAALMMRKAAELLVKGLANAEDEVHSLKAALANAEAQRVHYKDLLVETNSQVTSSQAYAQMSEAIGPQGGTAASSAVTFSGGGEASGDAVLKRSTKRGRGGGTGKGKAPARQAARRGESQQQEEEEGSGLATRGGDKAADRSTAADSMTPQNSASVRKRQREETATNTEGEVSKRQREQRGFADLLLSQTRNDREERNEQAQGEAHDGQGTSARQKGDSGGADGLRRHEENDEGKGSSRGNQDSGARRRSTVLPLTQEEPGGSRLSPLSVEEGEGEDAGDLHSAYDSDDAPSMFF